MKLQDEKTVSVDENWTKMSQLIASSLYMIIPVA